MLTITGGGQEAGEGGWSVGFCHEVSVAGAGACQDLTPAECEAYSIDVADASPLGYDPAATGTGTWNFNYG